jgi:sugar lactone lactonase YvrE
MNKKTTVMRNKLPFIFSFVVLSIFSGCESDEGEPQKTLESGDIDTFAGIGKVFGHTGDGGKANEAQIGWITSIAIDAAGDIYFTDAAANTVHKVTITDGNIHTIAGEFIGFNSNNQTPFAGDGGLATAATLNVPQAVGVDADGNVVIADAANERIRYVASPNSIISTVAGMGLQGYTGDGEDATEATLWNPFGIATDASGDIYFADSQNNVIRKITLSTGVITTVAGIGPDQAGFSGDNGPATEAKLHTPVGVAFGADGSMYISDSGNERIRKIAPDGTITTFAGTGEQGYSGDGGAATLAQFHFLRGIAVDADGNVYICDAGNSVVRKITAADGKIQTIAGNGIYSFSGDGGPATEAGLAGPYGVCVDKLGNVYIADTDNSAIRVVLK